jgi:hypothetical protein
MTTKVFDVITDVKEYFFRITGYLPKLKEQVTKSGSGGQACYTRPYPDFCVPLCLKMPNVGSNHDSFEK